MVKMSEVIEVERQAVDRLDALGVVGMAEGLAASGQRAEAIALYQLWLAVHADSPLAHAVLFNLGIHLLDANRVSEAKQMFRRSLATRYFPPSLVQLNRLNRCNNFGQSWIDIEFDFDCEIHHCFPRPGGNPSAYKVLNLATEPSVWCLSSREVRQVAEQFDLILTFREDLLDLPNARFMLFGSCQVTEVPQVKRFEVSFLYSVGLQQFELEGYALRAAIWQRRKALPDIFRYFASARRPPMEADHPWPYATKDKLFESMFSLVIENTSERNYFSEKVVDAFQTCTVPIYWGCPNMADHFDSRGIIFFRTADELSDILRNLSADDYYSRLDAVLRNRRKSDACKDILANMKRHICDAQARGPGSTVTAPPSRACIAGDAVGVDFSHQLAGTA